MLVTIRARKRRTEDSETLWGRGWQASMVPAYGGGVSLCLYVWWPETDVQRCL